VVLVCQHGDARQLLVFSPFVGRDAGAQLGCDAVGGQLGRAVWHLIMISSHP
jgi:hypothetical protein